MPLDPQAQALLEYLALEGTPPLEKLSVEEARRVARLWPKLACPPQPVAHIEDRTTSDGIPIRIYRPSGIGPFPTLVYMHGGGGVLGDLETAESPCRQLANSVGCVVVSVAYRLAPEHKFPVPPEDCYAATRYVAEHAGDFQGDPGRLAVAGDSAGGNVATVTTLMARDRGGPAIAFQLLIYPALNPQLDTASAQEYGDGYGLTRQGMRWFWDHYLARLEDRCNPYASPLCAQNLQGLPPACVITAEYDPLRDEGEAYAERLQRAGVAVDLRRYDGMIHGFFLMGRFLDQGKRVVEEAAAVLRHVFGSRAQ